MQNHTGPHRNHGMFWAPGQCQLGVSLFTCSFRNFDGNLGGREPTMVSHWEEPRMSKKDRFLYFPRASLIAQLVKNPPAMQETPVRFLGWEDPLEKGKATHSSVLAGEFHGLYSPWGHKESDMTEQLSLSISPNLAFSRMLV